MKVLPPTTTTHATSTAMVHTPAALTAEQHLESAKREIRAAQSSFEVVKLASAPLLISCGFIKESFNRDSAAVFLPSAMVFGSAAILGAAYALVVTPVLGVVAVAVATKHFYNATVHEGEAEKLRQ